jgi:hypothetical protein
MSDLTWDTVGECIFAPKPKVPDLPHWLIVNEWHSSDYGFGLTDDLFDIEHHPDCPTELVEGWAPTTSPDAAYETHGCIFQQMVDDMGIDSYFQHRDDPALDEWFTERVAPGRWLIEPWFETYYGHEGNEYDSGLRLATVPRNSAARSPEQL